MSDSEDESVDWRNPFAGKTSQLIDTASDFRWLIYQHLTQWADIRNMALALAHPQLQDELCAGIREIDFIDELCSQSELIPKGNPLGAQGSSSELIPKGNPLGAQGSSSELHDGVPFTIQFKSWVVPKRVKTTRQALAEKRSNFIRAFRTFEKLRKQFVNLKCIRCPWISHFPSTELELEEERIRIYEQLIYDPKAKFVNFRFVSLAGAKIPISCETSEELREELRRERHKQTFQWIYDALTVRIHRWGSRFCVAGDSTDHHTL